MKNNTQIREEIEKKLSPLMNHFNDKNPKAIYQYDEILRLHIIEIKPLDVFEDQYWIDQEYIITEEIESKFKNQELLFISENSLIKIDKSLPSKELFSKYTETFKNDLSYEKYSYKFNGIFRNISYTNNDDSISKAA